MLVNSRYPSLGYNSLILVFGLYITNKLKDALKLKESFKPSEKIVSTILDSKLVVVAIVFMLLIKLFIL